MKKDIWSEHDVECKLPELHKLKEFFEQANKETRDNAVLGSFGTRGVFYGNTISWCAFEIPASAMKLI